MGIDRKAANTALAKVIAYDACGKPQEADAWTVRLLETLGRADMIGGGFVAEREGATR